MEILYLTYGPQSGVISFLSRALGRRQCHVDVFNAAAHLKYRMERLKLPSVRPASLWNAVQSRREFGPDWKSLYLRTEFAFDRMSRAAASNLRRHTGRFSAIFQSGVLFTPPRSSDGVPCCLYIDNTHAIAKRYPHVEGVPSVDRLGPRYDEAEQRAYHQADVIFTMSELVRESLVAEYGVPADRIEVVRAGPNLDPLPKARTRAFVAPTVLFVGKDFLRKGGPVLLEAFSIVRARIPAAKLLVVGPPRPVHGPGVQYWGMLTFDQMADTYRQASVFALPTLQEPFGLAFLEAMAFGLPCVGTAVGAVPEIIDDERTGCLVPAGDAPALADRIIEVLEHPAWGRRMGQAGYQKVQERFNWDVVAGLILERLVRAK